MDFYKDSCCGAGQLPRQQVPSSSADRGHSLSSLPIGFGLALSANTAAMNRYAHLSESQKQEILNKAHTVKSEKEIYSLVARLANGVI